MISNEWGLFECVNADWYSLFILVEESVYSQWINQY